MNREPKTAANIGALIAATRGRAGYTRGELAAAVGVTVQALGAWERHERNPSRENVAALATCLEWDDDEMARALLLLHTTPAA